ncbi:MAG: hypothetical protein HOO93_10245 [Methyloglobulus sp.]|nr:hypothetical protein [Methyloglobulus sp.]
MQISEYRRPAAVSDPHAEAIKTLVDVMRIDFGERFTRAFADAEQLKQLKRRLYAQLKPFDVCDITKGYEDLVRIKPGFIPTIPEITDAVRQAAKLRATKPFVALPKPPRTIKPDFATMRKAIGANTGKSSEA